MFETLAAAEPDKILQLMDLFSTDARSNKLDLGVGVYRDAQGATPVMRAVRLAEQQLIANQRSKAYVGLAGDRAFIGALADIVFGDKRDRSRIRGIQTPGGSGAIRVLADLLALSRPEATVWLSDPTWANHAPTIQAAGLPVRSYAYFDATTGGVRFADMCESLQQADAGDIVLLHACCHNPTGANLSGSEWQVLGELFVQRGLVPFVDIAYQGFGDGLDEDAAGLRQLAQVVPEMAIAVSCSKNFAVYCDRVGAAFIVAANGAQADIAAGNLMAIARKSYSMPPNHGAAAVRIVLSDPTLRADWRAELDDMRERMLHLRQGLVQALRRHSNSDRFDFLGDHRGMFSRLGLTAAEVETLRQDHAIYMVGDSRINIAGLPDQGLDALATAIAQVVSR